MQLQLKTKLTPPKFFFKHNKYRLFLSLVYLLGFTSLFLLYDVSLWWAVAGLTWSKIVQLFGHSIGMHRYYSHKTFTPTKFAKYLMLCTSVLLGTGSPIAYARNHRQHHKVADKETDWHSPNVDGKFYTALGLWEFNSLSWFMERGGTAPRDLIIDPSIRFVHNYYYVIWFLLTILTASIDWKLTLYLLYLPALIYHIELNLFINCIGHSWGYRNFDTKDNTRNNNLVHWWLLGEGLHNNHHAEPWRYNWKITDKDAFDVSGWVIDKFLKV